MNTKTIDAFSSHVIIVIAGTAHTSERIDVMTQAWGWFPTPGPDGKNAYTELRKGTKNVVAVVRNSIAYPQTLRKKTPVVREVMVTWVPGPPVHTSLTEVPEADHHHQTPKLTVKQRQEKLFDELDLNAHTKKDCIHHLGSKKHWKVWSVLVIFPAWTWSPDSGKLSWLSLWNNTLHSLLAT